MVPINAILPGFSKASSKLGCLRFGRGLCSIFWQPNSYLHLTTLHHYSLLKIPKASNYSETYSVNNRWGGGSPNFLKVMLEMLQIKVGSCLSPSIPLGDVPRKLLVLQTIRLKNSCVRSPKTIKHFKNKFGVFYVPSVFDPLLFTCSNFSL